MKAILIILVIAFLLVIISTATWMLVPFSYSLDDDVAFQILTSNNNLEIQDPYERECLIELVQSLSIKRRIFRNVISKFADEDYIYLIANCKSYPYLGFHLSRKDLDDYYKSRRFSFDTYGNYINNHRELIIYLDSIIRG